jgi:hypothetical protein
MAGAFYPAQAARAAVCQATAVFIFRQVISNNPKPHDCLDKNITLVRAPH